MHFTETLHTTRLIADGAMGTELQKRGLPFNTPADGWVLSHPDEVLAVHRSYVAAGSQVVLTNTLNTNTATYDPQQVDRMNRHAAAVARQSGAAWVAGSVGPGGDATQLRALAAGGVDLIWMETQLCLADVVALIAICRAITPLPIVVSFSFHREDGRTHAGDDPRDIARTLSALDVAAIGMNCGNGLALVPIVLQLLRENTSLPLILKPNAGTPIVANTVLSYPLTATSWATEMHKMLSPAVHLIGGCCGTSPAFIRELVS